MDLVHPPAPPPSVSTSTPQSVPNQQQDDLKRIFIVFCEANVKCWRQYHWDTIPSPLSPPEFGQDPVYSGGAAAARVGFAASASGRPLSLSLLGVAVVPEDARGRGATPQLRGYVATVTRDHKLLPDGPEGWKHPILLAFGVCGTDELPMRYGYCTYCSGNEEQLQETANRCVSLRTL